LIHQFDDGHGIVQPRHCTSALVILGQENTEFDYMVVGGGKDRLYWCGIYDKEGREFVAVDPSKSSTTCVKVPTGQPTSVPLKETLMRLPRRPDTMVAAVTICSSARRPFLVTVSFFCFTDARSLGRFISPGRSSAINNADLMNIR
jgi:hypothetical protein